MRVLPGSRQASRPHSALSLAAGLLILAAGVAVQPVASAAPARPVPLFSLSDRRIAEASGLAVGHRSPSVLYLQNDSGDTARFFAIDARTGRTRAVCTVPGASNVDWEDLATGPDPRGVPSIWLADTGDNDAVRQQVQLYRVDEPVIGTASQLSTGRPDRWRLRYPDGPHDTESLIADPIGHRLYLLTKSLLGRSELFEVPARPDPARVQLLARVGSIDFSLTGTPGGPNPLGQLTATGASISPDGRLLAVRTYTDAYLWPVTGGAVAAAVRAHPIRLPLPAQPQGEGIAVTADGLLIDSEGVGSAVYRVSLPAAARPVSTGPATRPAGTALVRPPAAQPAGRWPHGVAAAALVAAGCVLLAAGVWRRLRRAARTRSW